ncbi:FGGY-family carbohydrate kinase [Pseudonocardia endophytica]|uniref:Xylulokinase n=1 Tax=Pseudonocardia endophytica TaxID=401976 RepID=A0A4R1I3D2_PSEEN|nr:FGGY-family carbohydrate kinase [Pseudonocardia endophytica]TCK27029.1 xylulokinase [Pseudonocardia endophytica]
MDTASTGALFLGIDLGTGSVKGTLTTVDGDVVATTTRPVTVQRPQPGFVEMDATTQWWDTVCSIARELADVADGRTVAAVGVSGLGPCLVMTGDDLEPLHPAILYGVDFRAEEQIASINAALGAAAVFERCGKDLSSQAVGPKLAWVREQLPEVWEKATRWFGSHSFVVARLTGEWVLDHHTASQVDPFYDLAARDWAGDWIAELLGDLSLPRLGWPHEIAGHLRPDAAEATGLPVGTPVVFGTVDAWAEAFSVGARRPGDLMLMYGSTMFMIQVLPSAASSPGLWTTCGVEPDSYTLAAGMSAGGSLVTWTHDLVGGAPYDELISEARAIPPGSGGLLVLPYFAGERSPIYDASARGVVVGLTLEHGRGHLFRAAYEGVAHGIRQNLEVMAGVVGRPERVIAVGGGVQGGLWTQIVSDVLGVPQELPAVTVGASYGDALLAAIGTGAVPPSTDWTRAAEIVRPDPDAAALHDRFHESYRTLYPATREHMHAMAAAQQDGS